ncbi:MAG: radical SAM protein [Candidatus Woesearchaeota archaeon]|jgi:hypothetical protein
MDLFDCKKGYYKGNLTDGCKLCVTGEKSVLFVTGICPQHCFYCPISDQKSQHDVVYINETPVNKFDDLVEEIKLCKSKGVSLTGGDPLARIDRSVEYIQKLKQTFGKEFHIHLYTSLELFTPENLKKLFDAGLDEIRCHPNIEDKKKWERIKNATAFPWMLGMEIPVIPGKEKETIELIDFAKQYVQFINLNEMEYSDTNACNLVGKYETKDSLSYGISGSEQMARMVLEKYPNLNIHYCSASFKDTVQMKRRIYKRAESIKLKGEEITDDGTLIRGVAYLLETKPGIKYREMLQALTNEQKQEYIQKLNNINKNLHFTVDDKKFRLLCGKKEILARKKLIKQMNLIPAIVEEYPTYDAFEVEIDFL